MKKAIKLVLIILPMLAVVFTLAAGVLVFSLAVISCNKDDYFEGEIIKKEFLEEHYEQRPVITLIYNGTVAVPVTTIWTYHYPKRWRLTVQRTKDEGNHEKQIYVTEECYDRRLRLLADELSLFPANSKLCFRHRSGQAPNCSL